MKKADGKSFARRKSDRQLEKLEREPLVIRIQVAVAKRIYEKGGCGGTLCCFAASLRPAPVAERDTAGSNERP